MNGTAGLTVLAGCALALLAPAMAWAQSGDAIVYRIKPGDTLSSLGQAMVAGRRDTREVARINRIRDVDLIYARAPLQIPRRVLRAVETPARVEAFSGQITVSDRGGARAPRLGDQLGEGATIVTGRNSFVTLRLSDASTIALPSQSTVQISRLRRVVLTGAVEREFKLQGGRARAKVTPMPNADSTFRVRTPVSHAAVRGTAFRSAYDEATGIALTEVDEGKVVVTAGDAQRKRELLLTPRYGAAVGASVSTGATALLEAPALADPGRTQTGPTLQFAIVPLAEAKGYRIEIARDAGLLDPIAEDASASPQLTFPSLPAGMYFARVAALDAQGLEGTSRVYAFERRRNSVAGTLLQSGTGRARRYQFKWDAEADGEPIFRFQLRRSGDPVPLVDQVGLKDRGITVANLLPGSYSWRVMSVIAGDGKPLAIWTPEMSFEVAKRR